MTSLWIRGELIGKHPHYRSLLFNFESDRGSNVVRITGFPGTTLIHRAFDLEKRQHLFANGIIQPLQPHQVGFYGSGSVSDLGVDIQKAEDMIDAKFSSKPGKNGDLDGSLLELKGEALGSGRAGKEEVL